jgi:hypothetical protein
MSMAATEATAMACTTGTEEAVTLICFDEDD